MKLTKRGAIVVGAAWFVTYLGAVILASGVSGCASIGVC